MVVQTKYFKQNKWLDAQVEVALMPGLPVLTITGLPDSMLKESALRVKCAIRNSGFQWPKARQVIVNLKPSGLKKTGPEMDLAIAAGILMKTGQIEKLNFSFLGELDLYGNVSAKIFEGKNTVVPVKADEAFLIAKDFPLSGGSYIEISELSELKQVSSLSLRQVEKVKYQRPVMAPATRVSEEQAAWMKISAVGGFHTLLAGPSGSGKTFAANLLHSVLPAPRSAYEDTDTTTPFFESWYPLRSPHHTTPIMSLLGGGARALPGELSLAEKGILILDELLEFKESFLEALREPMEKAEHTIHRLGGDLVVKGSAQVIATTNLCPCGEWTPDQRDLDCRFSKLKCGRVLQRLSGPVLDRFEMLIFTKQVSDSMRTYPVIDLVKEVEDIAQFQMTEFKKIRFAREQMISDFADAEIQMVQNFMPKEVSHRRLLATLRVARAIASTEFSTSIARSHIQRALRYTYLPFEALKKGL